MKLGIQAALVAAATSAAAPATGAQRRSEAGPTPPIQVAIGHSYSSASALRQPATFVVIAEEGAPLLTRFDGSVLARGALGSSGSWEAGARASTGSARPESRRLYGGVARAWRVTDPFLVSLAAEYEADGGFDVEKGVAGFEAGPLRGAPGLGRWVSRSVRLRWRPWLGIGYGNVFRAAAGRADVEDDGFWRAHARLEASYQPAGEARCDLEATSWLVDGEVRGTNFLKVALTVPIRGGLSVAADGQLGRRPPRFERERRIGIGLGFYRGFRSD